MRSPDEYDSIEAEILDDPLMWRDYARCLGVPESDDRLIFPGSNPPEKEETQQWIDDHCNECPVRQQCLDFALQTESIGIWGGVELTPSGVQRLKRLQNEEDQVTVERAKEILGWS